MRIMISGSIAYDNILSYGGRFSDHLVRESLDHINLTFVTCLLYTSDAADD